MILDFEDEIFNKAAGQIRETFPGLYITGEYVRAPAQFPAVSIVQRDSAAWRNSRNTSTNETNTAVQYEVNVYSNKHPGAKAECKKIMNRIDEVMTGWGLGFTRTMLMPVDNLADATIYRLVARYSGILGVDEYGHHLIIKR